MSKMQVPSVFFHKQVHAAPHAVPARLELFERELALIIGGASRAPWGGGGTGGGGGIEYNTSCYYNPGPPEGGRYLLDDCASAP